ncbi:MAG: sugar ABC transporter ATP-binding protein [Verrucomicrobia bacterium]|nr:sugar ABC transporter ATP-binding protein [Verrucomicrobiota bacterium]
MAPLLQTEGLSKSYAGPVLSEVSFDLEAGEVHALVGENGAGKSTFCGIVAGLRTPDAGQMRLQGQPYAPANKRAAEIHGVRIVLQELNLIETLSVGENLFFDQLPHTLGGWIDQPRLRKAAREALAQVGLLELDPDAPVSGLGIGQKQLVEIAAGLARHCRLLILDEPTAALTPTDAERLFLQIQKLKDAGVGIIYISHHLEEVLRLADRISVLRDGRRVATRRRGDLTVDEMIRLMVGRALDDTAARAEKRSAGPILLEVQNLSAPPRVREVSFALHRGEILGFAGLMGAGRTETVRALFGADPRQTGRILLNGRDITAELETPADAVRLGIGFLTEDRKSQGLLLDKPVRLNVTLAQLKGDLCGLAGTLRRRREVAAARTWVDRLAIRCASIEQVAGSLSGGNQQKAVLARWLYRNCQVLICDEPTRGIDVGAKSEIYRLLDQLAREGKGVLVVSSDLKELLALCDRIAVISAGRLVKTFDRGSWTEDQIMSAAFSEMKI